MGRRQRSRWVYEGPTRAVEVIHRRRMYLSGVGSVSSRKRCVRLVGERGVIVWFL